MFTSSIQTMGDNKDAPDYVYYNADIINNTTANTLNNAAPLDPQIRFNETRDSAIIQNAADYYFSIVRFTMNGPNKDLPLFIPQIKEGTGQTNVNLTVYSMAVPLTQAFSTSTQTITLTVQPKSRFMQYVSETQNPGQAPTPKSLANATFVGQFSATQAYQIGQIVSISAIDPLYNTYLDGPFYQVNTPAVYSYTIPYSAGSAVSFQDRFYYASIPVTAGVVPSTGGGWVLGTPVTGSQFYRTPDTSYYWGLVAKDEGESQDLSSRYYWVYTYQRWVDLWNLTMYDPAQVGSGPTAPSTCVYQDTYVALHQAWVANPALNGSYTFPYATFGDFCNFSGYPPQMTYDAVSGKFIIYGDSASFGPFPLQTFTPTAEAAPQIGIPSSPQTRLFFNSNMFGLFCNYDNIYYNTPAYPDGYVNDILFVNKFYKNILDTSVAPYSTYAPQVPTGGLISPAFNGRTYWLAEQDYISTDSLWSPIASVVFTSTLLPVKTEATGAPVVLGNGNNGFSAPITQAAFEPIITDIALDTSSSDGAASYRKFIYYVPSAEYRLSDFGMSKQDIRNVDIQVYWKNRLDNQLYPINMFNLSSVSLKVMFKHKRTMSGQSDR